MEIEFKSTDELMPYAKNARMHSEEQILQIASSIKEFGFTNPVLVDGNNGIIAGHGRVMAARKLGIESIPTIKLSHLTDKQKKAYIIADNKIALNSSWDEDLLKLELNDLSDDNFDLNLIGFDELELANLFDDGIRDNQESSAKEINTDDYEMNCTCPKCGFEFNNE